MKVQVYEKTELNLKLQQYNGYVALVAVDNKGDEISYLLEINKEGELWLNTNVSTRIGFKLDDKRRLKVNLKEGI